MKRRAVLAAAPLCALPAIGGCTGSLLGCPDPDVETPLSYENHRVDGDRVYTGENVAKLITSDEIGTDLEEALDAEAVAYISETNFDESAVVVVQVESSIDSDELAVLGVEREDAATVRTYTCVPDESGTDDWYPRTQIVRVEHEGQIPERAVGTHYREGTEVVIPDE